MRHTQVERTMTLRLDGPPDQSFPLFGPAREREWEAGWNPVFIAPDDGSACAPGTVFTTPPPDESVWVMTAYDRSLHEVRYVMLRPGLLTSEVSVEVEAAGPGSSLATVRYRRTALSDAGERALDEFLEAWPAWSARWQAAINQAIRNAQRRTLNVEG